MALRIFISSLFAFYTYAENCDAQSINELDWLLGEWIQIEGQDSTIESWSTLNDSTIIGNSNTYQNGSIVFSENLSIESRDDAFQYIAKLPSKTAVFTLKDLKNHEVSFIDPENDFPSLLQYKLSNDSLNILLSGSGKEMNLHFNKR